MLLCSVVYILGLHDGVVLEVCRLITSLVETVALGGERCQTVGLTEDNFTLDALDVASVAFAHIKSHKGGEGTYRESAFGAPLSS